MFEKEAEEYIKEHTFFDEEFGLTGLDVTSKTAFQEGAEFGYNKAFVEADKNLKAVVAVVADFNKANEWHYPSKDELPKCDEETQLMFYVNCYYNLGDETVTMLFLLLALIL